MESTMQSNGRIIRPEAGERFLSLVTDVRIKLAAPATGGAFAVIEHRVPPQGGPPPHTHRETELLYILSGSFAAIVGSEQSGVEAGTLIHVPPETVHTTRNIGRRAGRQLSIYLPGGGEGFFREAGTAVTNPDMLPDLDEPANLSGIDMSRIVALAARYGMRVTPDGVEAQQGSGTC
jgi:mannose-6-phosphate isomerase-like protein (cupin superfamily)